MSDGEYSDEDNSTIKLDDYNNVVRTNNRLETENSVLSLKVRQLTSELAKFKIESGVSLEFQFLVLASDLLTKYENTVFIPDSKIVDFQKTSRQTMELLKPLALSEPLSLTTEDIKCAKKIVLEANLTQQTLLSPFRKTAGLMKQAFNLLDYDCEGKFYKYKFEMPHGKKLGVRFPAVCQVRDDMKTAFITAYGKFVREEPEYWDKFIDQAIYMQVQSFLISITKWQDIHLVRDDLRKRQDIEALTFKSLKEAADAERHELMRKESDMRKKEKNYEQGEKPIRVKTTSVRTQTDEIEPLADNTAIMDLELGKFRAEKTIWLESNKRMQDQLSKQDQDLKNLESELQLERENIKIQVQKAEFSAKMEIELVKLRGEKTVWLESKKEMRDQLRKQEQDLKDLERELRLEKDNARAPVAKQELKKLEEMIIDANKRYDRVTSENNNLSVDIIMLTNSNTKMLQEADKAKQRVIFLEERLVNLEKDLDNRDDNAREAGVEADILIGKLKKQ